MENCKICNSGFENSPDEMVLCSNKEGFAHLGCCVSMCSMDGRPCEHCKAVYTKMSD